MKSTVELVKSDWLEDWFVICPNDGSGQPEGTSAEWREVFAAMRKRTGIRFKRCAVRFDPSGCAFFWSPRNSRNQNEAFLLADQVDDWIERFEPLLIAQRQPLCAAE